MKQHSFKQEGHQLLNITQETLKKAARKEKLPLPSTDDNVHVLKKHIHAAVSHVIGLDQSQTRLQSQLWSTAVFFDPPSLWITIDPCDLYDLIIQVFVEEHINIDHFSSIIGVDKEQLAQNVTCISYVSAKYFHFLVWTVLETSCGIKPLVHSKAITSQSGVFEKLTGYFRTAKSQGWSSLHLHMFIYFSGVPTMTKLKKALKTGFQRWIIQFFKDNIHMEIPGLCLKQNLDQLPNNMKVVWSRSPDPSLPEDVYLEEMDKMEATVTCAKQVGIYIYTLV